MSMKRILGTMLATRMAGRGRRKGALGTAGALGLLGSGRRRHRGGIGGKLGLAAMGYMAYRAFQDSQSRSTTAPGTRTGGTGSGGGLMDQIKDAANQFLGDGSASGSSAAQQPQEQDLKESEAAADRFSENEALLLIRAMITAAYSDGSLSQDERGRILQAIDDANATPEDRAAMEREIANPKPLDDLLVEVNDEETAEEFYLASRAALDGETESDRRYLSNLRDRLGLSAEDAAEAEAIAS